MALDGTYARVLANVPQKHQQYITRILQFLIYSKRPLRLEEVVDALAVRLEDTPPFDPKDRVDDIQEILDYCSNLVKITTITEFNETVKYIQLVHLSLKQWLRSDRLDERNGEHITKTAANTVITEVCLTYLLDIKNELPPHLLRLARPLAGYAAAYWVDHVVMGNYRGNPGRDLVLEFLKSEKSFQIAHKIRDKHSGRAPPALHFAVSQNLTYYVRLLLEEEGVNVDARDQNQETPLIAASRAGYEDFVRLLLDKGAGINAEDGPGGNALQTASFLGHENIVRTLLERGADVDARGQLYGTALQAASYRGRENIVQVLLNWGADVDVRGGPYGTAHQAASGRNHRRIVEMLEVVGA